MTPLLPIGPLPGTPLQGLPSKLGNLPFPRFANEFVAARKPRDRATELLDALPACFLHSSGKEVKCSFGWTSRGPNRRCLDPLCASRHPLPPQTSRPPCGCRSAFRYR